MKRLLKREKTFLKKRVLSHFNSLIIFLLLIFYLSYFMNSKKKLFFMESMGKIRIPIKNIQFIY